MASDSEWEEDASPEYVILDACGLCLAGGFDSAADAIRAAKLMDDVVEVEARKTLRRRVWCTVDEMFSI